MRKPPLVMIPGAFCGGWAFEDFAKPFAQAGYVVHTPSLRHHDGASVDALATTSLLDYAADLERLIAELGETPVLLGHSMGGLLAQMLAAKGLARAAILLAPSAPWGVLPTTFFEIAAAQSLYLAGDFWNQALVPHYAIAAANSLDKLSGAKRDSVFARFVPESGLATFETMHWMLDVRRAAEVRARDVTCPLLCLVGAEDRINPPSTVRQIAGRYGNALFEELAAKSHWLIGEDGWEDVALRAIAWLDDVLRNKKKTSSRLRDVAAADPS